MPATPIIYRSIKASKQQSTRVEMQNELIDFSGNNDLQVDRALPFDHKLVTWLCSQQQQINLEILRHPT